MSPKEQLKEQLPTILHDKEVASEQMEKLLATAEALQDKYEARDRRLWLTLFAGVTLLGVLGALPALLTTIPDLQGTKASTGVQAWAFSLSLWLVIVTCTLCFRDWRRQRRDKRTIHEIVDMLREVEAAVMMYHHFTALEEQNLRIRLRRFEIGPEVDRIERHR